MRFVVDSRESAVIITRPSTPLATQDVTNRLAPRPSRRPSSAHLDGRTPRPPRAPRCATTAGASSRAAKAHLEERLVEFYERSLEIRGTVRLLGVLEPVVPKCRASSAVFICATRQVVPMALRRQDAVS